jgi:signal transduction histidine kinase/CheY-like chemotaxis protein
MKGSTDPRDLERYDTLRDVNLSCTAAVDILNDLLCYEKLESGRMELHKDKVVICSFLKDCVSLFSAEARERQVHISLTLGDALPAHTLIGPRIHPHTGTHPGTNTNSSAHPSTRSLSHLGPPLRTHNSAHTGAHTNSGCSRTGSPSHNKTFPFPEINSEDNEKEDEEEGMNVTDYTAFDRLLPDDTVLIDRFKMDQVIRNIISNALKFTPPGGKVDIKASFCPKHAPPVLDGIPGHIGGKNTGGIFGPISLFQTVKSGVRNLLKCPISAKSRNEDAQTQANTTGHMTHRKSSSLPHQPHEPVVGSLVVVITDTGAGISRENQKRLFNEIIQFSPELLQAGGGSGLGLWITKGILDLHSGSIFVQSEGEGFGTTFTVEIPMARFASHPIEYEVSPLDTQTHVQSQSQSHTQAVGLGAPTIDPTVRERGIPGSRTRNIIVRGSTVVDDEPYIPDQLLSKSNCEVEELDRDRDRDRDIDSHSSGRNTPSPAPTLGATPTPTQAPSAFRPGCPENLFFFPNSRVSAKILPSSKDRIPNPNQDSNRTATFDSGFGDCTSLESNTKSSWLRNAQPTNTNSQKVIPMRDNNKSYHYREESEYMTAGRDRGRERTAGGIDRSDSKFQKTTTDNIELGPGTDSRPRTNSGPRTFLPPAGPGGPGPGARPDSRPGTDSEPTHTGTKTSAVDADSEPPFQLQLLVVDDSSLSRKMLAKCLRAEGHVCLEAADGLEAVALVRERLRQCREGGGVVGGGIGVGEPIHVILMDYLMPNMDGPTATKEIRALGYTAPIFGLTGNGMSKTSLKFKETMRCWVKEELKRFVIFQNNFSLINTVIKSVSAIPYFRFIPFLFHEFYLQVSPPMWNISGAVVLTVCC